MLTQIAFQSSGNGDYGNLTSAYCQMFIYYISYGLQFLWFTDQFGIVQFEANTQMFKTLQYEKTKSRRIPQSQVVNFTF